MFACIYLVHSTNIIRSQTGDTDCEHKPKSLSLWHMGKLCAGCYYEFMALTNRYVIIDNSLKPQTITFDNFMPYNSSKFDKTPFWHITHRLYMEADG